LASSLARCSSPVRVVDERRVVSRAHGVEAELQRALEERGELDLLVAPHAGIRRAPGLVLGHEVVDDVLAEALGEVPDVERDAEEVGRATGIHRVFDRAAAAAAGAKRAPARESARCTPTTSWPASTARAAATAESTPPLMAARIRMVQSTSARAPRPPRVRQSGERRIDVRLGGGAPERQAQHRSRGTLVASEREHDMRWLAPA
jgi:hypothetical protein